MMVVILHGTGGSSKGEWFVWLKLELEKMGYQVWVPDLPGADEPDVNEYNQFIIDNCPFKLNEETIIIGHSSGAVAALGLVQILPSRVGQVILVAGFVDDLDYGPVKKMFRTWKFDWEKIKKRAKKIIAVCSNDDPFVPTKHGKELERLLGAKLIVILGQKHFSVSTFAKYSRFPELLDLISGY